MTAAAPLLSIKNLSVGYEQDARVYPILDDISFAIAEGEVFGLVGESGCGKSMTAMSILKLFDATQIKVGGGEIVFGGRDLLALDDAAMRGIRTREIAMIFQDPMTSLNPVYTVGEQIAEAVREHLHLSPRAAWGAAEDAIAAVGIPDPKHSAKKYPHQLSGGMRQRVMIAMALSCQPKLLIADEPTTALDVTVQHQIISLILQMQTQYKMAVLLITHDLGLVAETAARLGVMYAGNMVEIGDTASVFANPQHPYTQGLISCIPNLHTQQDELAAIDGSVPSLQEVRTGCLFAPRCPQRMAVCTTTQPSLAAAPSIATNHQSACWLHQPHPPNPTPAAP